MLKQNEARDDADFAHIETSPYLKYKARRKRDHSEYGAQSKCNDETAPDLYVLNDAAYSQIKIFEKDLIRYEEKKIEVDIVLQHNLSTICILEREMAKMNGMTSDEKERYRLDDTFGGSSEVLQQVAIKRIYGNKAGAIIDGLKERPYVAVPVVLKRLNSKQEEWKKIKKNVDEIWMEKCEECYYKSSHVQSTYFKQNDIKFLSVKSILNEMETLHKEADKQANDGEVSLRPQLVLFFKCKDTFKDVIKLIIDYVKRENTIVKEDREEIQKVICRFFYEFFSVSCDDGINIEHNDVHIRETSARSKSSPEVDEKNSHGKNYVFAQNASNGSVCDESYTLMFANENWFIFLRFLHILYIRLWKMREYSELLNAEKMTERKWIAAIKCKLKKKIVVQSYYSVFLNMVEFLIHGSIKNDEYEDRLIKMFGMNAHVSFTLDRVIRYVVRQLKHIVKDESSTQCNTLFLEEIKNKATDSLCATASERATAELAYQKRAQQIRYNKHLFKLMMFKEEGKLTIELLVSSSEQNRQS